MSQVMDIHDIAAVQSGDIKAALPRRKLTARTPDELLGMAFDDSDRLLGDRLLAKGQALTILASGGTGKSRLLLMLAVCMITGRKFLDFETNARGLKWLIIQTENSNRRLQSDFRSLRAWTSPEDWPMVEQCLVIHTLETDEDGMVDLGNMENLNAVGDLIAEHKPDIVAFDPLGDFGIGNLDKDEDMRSTCRAISSIGKKGKPDRAIVVLHHSLTGKQGAFRATGFDRGSFGRNSKVLQAWTRGQINITAIDPDSNARLLFACGKCSNGKEFETFASLLNPETMIYELQPDFDVGAWQSQMANSKKPNPLREPTDDEFLALLPVTVPEDNPRAGVVNTDQLKAAFRKKGFAKELLREIRGCLNGKGIIRETKGPLNNETLCGRPEMVARYEKWRAAIKAQPVQTDLPESSPRPKRKAKKSPAD